MKDTLLIISGGMDSVTLLHECKERIALGLSFDYGSKHNESEIPFARMNCESLGIEYILIPLGFINEYFKSDLLKSGGDIPEGHYAAENMRSTVVPFRNGIMLSIATGIAESRGLKYVFMANHGGDHAIYPDCREEFIRAINQAAQTGTAEGIQIIGPYTAINKTEIARIGKRLGIDYGTQTWSCYKGGKRHCGKCGTCVERREALKEANIKDSTLYEQ